MDKAEVIDMLAKRTLWVALAVVVAVIAIVGAIVLSGGGGGGVPGY